jgi:hypothetical protein
VRDSRGIALKSIENRDNFDIEVFSEWKNWPISVTRSRYNSIKKRPILRCFL